MENETRQMTKVSPFTDNNDVILNNEYEYNWHK